jgi:endonuclease/exonuclease/phosphatase family metal-dependent hydrolase
MTYNIRACLGTDGVRSIDRVAAVINAERPDVGALQEVDLKRSRSGDVDQAAEIAERTDMHWVAGASMEQQGWYGNAVLSRVPIVPVVHDALPRHGRGEPRSAMWVRLELPSPLGEVNLINTHLSFRWRERVRQIGDLLGEGWLLSGRAGESPAGGGKLILCGDLNCSLGSWTCRRLAASPPGLRDVHRILKTRSRATWPTRRPWRRLDHILVSASLGVRAAGVHRSAAARLASDHYPVIADVTDAGASRP